jgi:hypothetical protein
MAEERTKHIATLRYNTMKYAKACGVDPEEAVEKLPEDFVKGIALLSTSNPTTSTRVDRRFPNVNQANNCWCAARRRESATSAG